MPNRKLQYFWRELQKGLDIFWGVALNYIGIAIIIYGGLLLYEYIATGKLGIESADMITVSIAIVAAIIIFVGFLVTFIQVLVSTSRYNHDKDITIDSSKVFNIAPSINIQISSKDIRHMDSNKITHFFRGVKQSLIEYRKAIKEVQKYEQEIVKRQSTTKTRAKETKDEK
jgi:hypothetical protein